LHRAFYQISEEKMKSMKIVNRGKNPTCLVQYIADSVGTITEYGDVKEEFKELKESNEESFR
jgi:hypothetical protein